MPLALVDIVYHALAAQLVAILVAPGQADMCIYAETSYGERKRELAVHAAPYGPAI